MIKSVRIGGFTYAVENPEQIPNEDREGEFQDGDVSFQDMLIQVAQAAPQMEAATLVHESIHAILEHANMRHSERIVHILGYGIAQLIGENPELVTLIQKAWSKQPELKVVKNTA